MRRLVPTLVAVAAVAAAPLAAGCGSEDLPSVSLAKAAQATRDAHTARTEIRVELSGMGLPQRVTVSGEGIVATDAPRMDLTFDSGLLLGLADEGEARLLVDGRNLYADIPEIEGLEIPGDTTWIALDLARLAEALRLDPEGLAHLFRMTPAQQLAALEAASMKEVGEEEVDGVRTTHLRGTVTFRDYGRVLSAEQRSQLERAIRRLAELSGETPESFDTPAPTEMWVDEDAHIRRMTQRSDVPAQDGAPAGSIEITVEFDDFGTPFDIDAPEGDDVFDATEVLARELRGAP